MPGSNQNSPALHPEGIVFGMPAELYHADAALGSHGLKLLMRSAADYWWSSWMNDGATHDHGRDPAHFRFGSALHTLVLEGEAAFAAAYAVTPDPGVIPGLLRTADDLRAFLRENGLPSSGGKAILLDRVRQFWLAQGGNATDCPIWDDFVETASKGGRKTLLSAREYDHIRLAARMLATNPVLSECFATADKTRTHTLAEVSVFWREPVQIGTDTVVEVPCKARFDRLSLKTIIDLKTTSNSKGLALSLAMPQQIHALGYDLQAAHYMAAREMARVFVKEGKVFARDGAKRPPEYWLRAFPHIRPLQAEEDPARSLAWFWGWIFVQNTGAPIAECRIARFDSDVIVKARKERALMLQRFADNAARFGTGIWLHAPQVEELALKEMPNWRRFRPDRRTSDWQQ